ncbi:hypothetical protein [Caballeronia calidae]|uniref:hypothetical protein n=1 Tax=Caballeronia calidae TaxID=1777139 RepID=UPI0012FE46AB|nr:hypothetical protein [Caballeronia calidae]
MTDGAARPPLRTFLLTVEVRKDGQRSVIRRKEQGPPATVQKYGAGERGAWTARVSDVGITRRTAERKTTDEKEKK